MGDGLVFDGEPSCRINRSRIAALDNFIPQMITRLEMESCLDVGCGVGYFAEYMQSLGLRTVAFDARAENVAEARRRFPAITFEVFDVESPELRVLGAFDLVLCVGLLYHLENPFAALRNLGTMTKKVLVIESMVAPGPLPMALLRDEVHTEDQALRYVAFVPSESCITKMLHSAGFGNVYRVKVLPDHEDFKDSLTHKKVRTMLVASKVPLDVPQLTPIQEPESVFVVREGVGYYRDLAKVAINKLATRIRNML